MVRWFSLGTLVSSTNKTDPHDITEILLKVVLNTINQTNQAKKMTTTYNIGNPGSGLGKAKTFGGESQPYL